MYENKLYLSKKKKKKVVLPPHFILAQIIYLNIIFKDTDDFITDYILISTLGLQILS